MDENQVNNNYFYGFTWAIPKAFAIPLNECRFEEGDLLYDNKLAYEQPWSMAIKQMKYSIQIQLPMRGTVSKMDKDKDSVFTDNWHQSVTFELNDYQSNLTKIIKTTQGRLYTLLWKGDFSVLDETHADPPTPSLSKAVIKQLSHTVPSFKNQISRLMNAPNLFIMPFDLSNDLLKSKEIKIENALSEQFAIKKIYLTPEEAGLKAQNGFAPTLLLLCIAIDSPSPSNMKEILKSALYSPSKDKKSITERFRLEAHGYFVSLQ